MRRAWVPAAAVAVLLATLPMRWLTVTYSTRGYFTDELHPARPDRVFTGLDLLTQEERAVDGYRVALMIVFVAMGLAVLALLSQTWLRRLSAGLGSVAVLVALVAVSIGQDHATDRPYVVSDHTYAVGAAGVAASVLAAGLLWLAVARRGRLAPQPVLV